MKPAFCPFLAAPLPRLSEDPSRRLPCALSPYACLFSGCSYTPYFLADHCLSVLLMLWRLFVLVPVPVLFAGYAVLVGIRNLSVFLFLFVLAASFCVSILVHFASPSARIDFHIPP